MKNFIKLSILLTFSIFCLLNCQASEVKFAFITDVDLNVQNAYKLQNTIKEINSFDDLDFVVFGGNNIQKTKIDNLNVFAHLIRKVNKKTIVLLGNQDVLSSNGITKDYYLKKIRRARLFRHSSVPNYTFKSNGYIFVVMDGSKQYFQSSNGYYSLEELTWLDKTLKKHKDENVIILQHFPILETSSAWLQTPKLEEYYKIIAKYNNIKSIISGHYGINFEGKSHGFYNILTEKYSKNLAYRIIQIDSEDNFIGSFLIK